MNTSVSILVILELALEDFVYMDVVDFTNVSILVILELALEEKVGGYEYQGNWKLQSLLFWNWL